MNTRVIVTRKSRSMQSPENTLVGPGEPITDGQGNIWTISTSGQVAVNGQVDPTTANVTHLAYAGGLVWQENTNDLWWSKTSPTDQWAPLYGTPTVPVTLPIVSVNDSVIGVPVAGILSPPLTDNSANTWAIVNGQVAVNGVIDPTTANVIELAYVNGRIWQENNQGLWWSKTAPADTWNPLYGTTTNPVTGSFHPANGGAAQAIINVGEVTTSPGGGGPAPQSIAQIVTPGVRADASTITIVTETATLVVNGDSHLTNGAELNLIGGYRTPLPVQGPLENNGVMTINDSTLKVSALSGTGTIKAVNGSTLDIQSSSADNLIQLRSSHLYIGEQPFGAGGLTFLAPITMNQASTIALNQTPATSEAISYFAGSTSEVFLYNGSTQVADLKVRGVSHLYATESGTGASAMTILSTTQTSHDLPIVSHTG